MPMAFRKMHGLGNDFVVIDGRESRFELTAATARAIADRHTGVGCDQIVLIAQPDRDDAAIRLVFFNADGSEAGACGNGTRCAASFVMELQGSSSLAIETGAGLLNAERSPRGLVTVDMGQPRLAWSDIPLRDQIDSLEVPLAEYGLGSASCTSMGNPHATFFVADAARIDLERLGPSIEHDPLFPRRVNVGVAQILDRRRMILRVWERGAGETLACGSGACAALVAGARRGLCDREAEIILALGSLHVTWRRDGHVMLAGPVATSFTGMLDRSLSER